MNNPVIGERIYNFGKALLYSPFVYDVVSDRVVRVRDVLKHMFYYVEVIRLDNGNLGWIREIKTLEEAVLI